MAKDGLSNKQKLAAELMVANPEMHYEEVAAELGITSMTLYRWRKLPEFQEYSHELCVEKFKEIERLAIQKLLENVKKSNQKAIQYCLDYVGFKSATELEVKDKTIRIEIEE